MTGPEHYAEAERLLNSAAAEVIHAVRNTAMQGHHLNEALATQDRAARVAQVHATLALVAITVESPFLRDRVNYARGAWPAVIR